MSDQHAYYLSTARQLRAWKILSVLLLIPCAAFATMYLQAEISFSSSSSIIAAEATVVSRETTKIWGLVNRPRLTLEMQGAEEPAFTVLMTLAEDDVSDTPRVAFSRAHPKRVFVVGDYPYWPYSIAFAVGPLLLFLASRFFEARYRRLAEEPRSGAPTREKET